MKRLSIDFYRVVMPQGADTFENILQGANQLAAGAARNLDVGGAPIRLQEFGAWQHCVEGEMVRIRMDMLPRKASLAGELDDLDLDADEGLGEESAFLYDPRMRVLLIQRNRTGVSASALAWYFKEKGHLAGPINLEPVLQRGVMQKLANMTSVRRVDIALAGLDAAGILRNQGHGVGEVVRLSEELRAPKMSISLSVGRRRRAGLSLDRAVALVRRLHTLSEEHREQIEKVEIAGLGGADEKVVLDLIEERIVETELVRPDQNRTIPNEARRGAVRRAYENRRQELADMFQRR